MPFAGPNGTDAMRRSPLYSKSGKPRVAGVSHWVARDGVSPVLVNVEDEAEGPPLRQRVGAWWNKLYGRNQGRILVATSALVTLALVGIYDFVSPDPMD